MGVGAHLRADEATAEDDGELEAEAAGAVDVPAQASDIHNGYARSLSCVTPRWPLLTPSPAMRAVALWDKLAHWVRRGGASLDAAHGRRLWWTLPNRWPELLSEAQRVRVEVSLNGGAWFTTTRDAGSEFVFYDHPTVVGVEPGTAPSAASKPTSMHGCVNPAAVARGMSAVSIHAAHGGFAAVLRACRGTRLRQAYATGAAAVREHDDRPAGVAPRYTSTVDGVGGGEAAQPSRVMRREDAARLYHAAMAAHTPSEERLFGELGAEVPRDRTSILGPVLDAAIARRVVQQFGPFDVREQVPSLQELADGAASAAAAEGPQPGFFLDDVSAMYSRFDATGVAADWLALWSRVDVAGKVEAQAMQYLFEWNRHFPTR